MRPLRHAHLPVWSPTRVERRSERGETLVELLGAVALMGGAIVAFLVGITTMIRISSGVERSTRASNHAQATAERIKQPVEAMAYVPCAVNSSYSTTAAGGYTIQVIGVEYLDTITRAPNSTTPGSVTWRNNCTGGDRGLQRITVEVTNGSGPAQERERVRLVKRDARCAYSPGYENLDQGPC